MASVWKRAKACHDFIMILLCFTAVPVLLTQREMVSSLGTGKQFDIFVMVGYYTLPSLAVLTFYFI